MSDSTVRGRFVWHELMTTDPAAAAEFYREVAGWDSQPWSNDASYTLLTTAAGPMAGVMTIPDDAKAMGAPPSWLVYMGTPDADETVRHAESLGGRVLRAPADVPGVGRFAVVADPQGAVFAVLQPNGESRPDNATVALGDFSWHELATTDWKAAFEFYHALFGWEMTDAMDMGPEMGTYQMFGWHGRTLGGMFTKPAQMPGPPYWLPYAKVRDAKGAAATITRIGGQVLNGPMEVPGGDWITQGMDPQGAVFAVHSAAPALQAVPAAPKPARAKPAPKAKPKKAAPKKAAKKKAAKKVAKKAAPKKVAKKAAPRKVARKAAPKKVARKAAPKKIAKKAAPKKAVKKKAAKQKSAPRKTAKRRLVPKTARRATKRAGAAKRRRR